VCALSVQQHNDSVKGGTGPTRLLRLEVPAQLWQAVPSACTVRNPTLLPNDFAV